LEVGVSGEGRDRGSGWGLPYERRREIHGWQVIEEEERNGGVEGGGKCIRRRGEPTGSIQIQNAHPHHLPA